MSSIASSHQLPDKAERQAALDISTSVLVQAPAGSGKTQLLTCRFLKLLAHVDEPEQVLAITFTRAATAEMRTRILKALGDAAATSASENYPPDSIESLALAALRHSESLDWKLLEQPSRLRIETIDSYCLSLAQRSPLMGRMGGRLSPVDNAESLYNLAAIRTLQMLEGDSKFSIALQHLLATQDNDLSRCVRLIKRMLARRDVWIGFVSPLLQLLLSDQREDAATQPLNLLRARLEGYFQNILRSSFAHIRQMLAPYESTIVSLIRFAASNLPQEQPLYPMRDLAQFPSDDPRHRESWIAIAGFLLTNDHELRKKVTKLHGFPANQSQKKDEMHSLLEQLRQDPEIERALGSLRHLPAVTYTDAQWKSLESIFTVLMLAAANLRAVFAEQDKVDFVELGIAARAILHGSSASPHFFSRQSQAAQGSLFDQQEANEDDPFEADAPSDIAIQEGARIRHLLFDEFQDTSRAQHELLRLLVSAWDSDEGPTAFFVGDPMQSIYSFRQAEVSLFHQVATAGLATHSSTIKAVPIQLQTNFRSTPALVGEVNRHFPAVFAQAEAASTNGVVPFIPGTPLSVEEDVESEPAWNVHSFFCDKTNSAQSFLLAAGQRHGSIVLLLKTYLQQMDQARAEGREFSIAVLAAAKQTLMELAFELRCNQIPFQAIEIESLSERQEVVDALALLRALLDLTDRVSWLAVLRAPWCGISIHDLHALVTAIDAAGSHHAENTIWPSITTDLLHTSGLSSEGVERIQKIIPALDHALAERNAHPEISIGSWLQQPWSHLRGESCYDQASVQNVDLLFSLLDQLPQGELDVFGEELSSRLENLCALPDPSVDPATGIQLMTIHKAKGLGFDVVVVTGLERSPAIDDTDLLSWLEFDTGGTEDERQIFIAPISSAIEAEEEGDNLNEKWIRRQIRERVREERKRVFYVACTRARKQVHLFGIANVKDGQLQSPPSNTLLNTAWPALQPYFEQQLAQAQATSSASSNLIPMPAPDHSFDLAAEAGEEDMGDAPARKIITKRLPIDTPYPVPFRTPTYTVTVPEKESGLRSVEQAPDDPRPQASLEQRVFGNIVHLMLEQVSSSLKKDGDTRLPWKSMEEQAINQSLRWGLSQQKAVEQARNAIQAVNQTLEDEVGRWLLGTRTDAASEQEWTLALDQQVQNIRADRIFHAGAAPLQDGENIWWVVDYKTARPQRNLSLEDFLSQQKNYYQPQLEKYARALQLIHGKNIDIRVGIYYPRLPHFDWWIPDLKG